LRKILGTIALGLALGTGGFLLGLSAAAQGQPTPGSAADPLATVSYVQSAIQQALAHFNPPPGATGTNAFTVVTLPAGATMTLAAGTEVVLRSGRVTAVASPQGGLADLTGGRDLANGSPVAANHLLLCPRSDGRGLVAVSDAILLVSGGYQIGSGTGQ
jgi:hypothetical protein